jgi:signal transduction histidine kinase
MLFLVNESEGVLEGRVGVGPGSAAEAGRVWADMGRSDWTLSQWLEWTLEQDRNRGEDDIIHRVAQSVRVPLADERCVLIEAMKKRAAFRMDPRANPRGIEMLTPLEIGAQCAVAPVRARGETLGVILVDNLYSARPIEERDLRFLSAFASLAGMAIQNAQFYEGLKRAHKDLQSMQQKLIQSEKLAALGEFAATMAHEIRNPLVSIGGYARLLQKRHREAYARIIFEEVERLEGILSRVLAFSRIAPGDRTDEDLALLLEESHRSLRGDIDPRRVRFEKEWTQSLPQVHCDREQIKQVFLNLVQNAMDAVEGRGTITLRTFLSSEEDGMWVVGEVGDSGGGIPADILPNIFNPFFTTKQRGTGLGLAITRRIVETHGGKIEVDNRLGEGTLFRVKLPPAF